ncbi:MAG TPA: response regulator [Terriglobales bacterium]|nr:response regulator [Terriglobales bacterium]
MENRTDAYTVLCVDDEDGQLKVRKLLLESQGYRVLTATSGAEGISLFRSDHIDAVVLDYWMAGMTGVAVARELKKTSPNTPIIILSAYVQLPDEALGVADIWILKGEDPQYLLSKLKQLLAARATKQSANIQ